MAEMTRGPWRYDRADNLIVAESGRFVASAHGYRDNDEPDCREINDANARAIAAVPEMVALIRRLVDAGAYDRNEATAILERIEQ